MPFELKIATASVVLVGEFVPTVFHPAWLKAHNLLAAAEADAAKVEIIHAEVTAVTTEWLALNVRRDRFTATCTRGESMPLLKDFVLGVFQLFPNLPATAMGLNRDQHFQASNEDEWHDLGHKLAPKEPWNALLHKPGMLTVQMQGERQDKYEGKINVLVQPSSKLKFGAFVQVNDHYNFVKEKTPGSASDAIGVIKENWKTSFDRSEHIANKIAAK